MTKRTIILIATAVIFALLIGIGTYVIINRNNDDEPNVEVPDDPGSEPDPDTNPDLGSTANNKAKVILLGGQSNAAGCSYDDYLKIRTTPEKYAEYEAGYDNVYINYFATGTNFSNGFVKCSVKQGEAGVCFGPELGLADKLHELYPDQTFFIIKWAWGGSNLYDQWRAPSGGTGEGSFYRAFVDFVSTSLALIENMGYEYEIEAMCWMQGESDAFVDIANAYGQNLTNLINAIRAEFVSHASADGIAFIDAYISDSPYWALYQTVNAEKQKVADSSPINVAINTIAEGLTYSNEPEGSPDLAHYDALSEIKLGHLFATEAAKFFG